MEVWGGIECSINRIGENYFDQLEYYNLYRRPELITPILELGLKTLRFPILWEKNWPDQNKAPVWAVEKQLEILKKSNVNIIAGLVHHGSGPASASIESDDFAEKFATYAKSVAIKFPWINDYTPINEMLTTARFCGLYGLWYPHHKNTNSFLKILINQCRATILAMRAIRKVNPIARLIVTEDLTKIHGTQELQTQVNFENHRRWLSLDLLCGKVDNIHPLWDYLKEHGVTDDQLQFFIENAIVPDLLGFNYYVTSERYLDHKLENYPSSNHGGNGQICYADIEAVRHPLAAVTGLTGLMREAWLRYQLPMAVTEAHLCCGREDQLRWLKSIWDACAKLNTEGIHVIAVTFWALFGAYGWDKLLTRKKGRYESGVFDLSSGVPRQTAVAKLIIAFAYGKSYCSPVINGTGWWERNDLYTKDLQPVMIIGCSGILGSALTRICAERNIFFTTYDDNQRGIKNPEHINRAISRCRPWAIIDAATYANPDILGRTIKKYKQTDNAGTIHLAKTAKKHQLPLLSFSSDRIILSIYKSAIVIRPSPFGSSGNRQNFDGLFLERLKNENEINAMNDEIISATNMSHLIHLALNLLIDEEHGFWHVT